MDTETVPLVNDDFTGTKPSSKKKIIWISVGVIILVGAIVGLGLGFGLSKGKKTNPAAPLPFPFNIELSRMEDTLKTFETWGTRAPGTTGANTSYAYLEAKLKALDCDFSIQEFSVPVFTRLANPSLSIHNALLNLTLALTTDFVQASYGGSVTAFYQNYNMTQISGSGCTVDEWSTFPAGQVALVDLDAGFANCTPFARALNAQQAGASSVLFVTYSSVGRPLAYSLSDFPWYEGMVTGTNIPVLILSRTVGSILLTSDLKFQVTLNVSSLITMERTRNTFCDTRIGNPNTMVVYGAHYDSVPAGPGVNDDGSGSAALLELITAWSTSGVDAKNKVRFAWWGAEELGLIGSFQFVKLANTTGLIKNIKAYMNMDMLASTNGYFQIHHPDENHPLMGVPPQTYPGSKYLGELLSKFAAGTPHGMIALEANSDYYPFIDYGVPASGAATGAGELVDRNTSMTYKLLENVPNDPCYHKSCDTFNNINSALLSQVTKALARSLFELASDEHLVEHLAGGVVSK